MKYLLIKFPDTMSFSHLSVGDTVDVVTRDYHSHGSVVTIEEFCRLKSQTCTAENPCCDRRGEYNGFGSGELKFVCPKHCSCHD